MKGGNTVASGVILLFFLLSICHGWAESYTDLHLDGDRVVWTDLSYQAKTFVVDVSTDITLVRCANKDFEALWLSHPKSLALPAPPSVVYRIEVKTSIDHIFSRPVKLLEHVWFEPLQATAFYRIRLRRGQDDIERVYWFTADGVHRLRKRPGNKEEVSLPPDQWTDIRSSFYPYDLPQVGCPHVSEPSLLIYIVSAFFNSKSNSPLSLCVFGKQQLHHLRLWMDESRNAVVDYIEKRGNRDVRRRGKTDIVRVRLTAEPAKSAQQDPENFSFLGFHKNIAIDVDPQLHLPVQVSGTIPTVGTVTLKLSEAKLRK
jgi:hypothetical protein